MIVINNILIVAFDGLDQELIEKYDCHSVMQEEFGRIDNDTDIYRRMTPELFASFITGETWEKHGIGPGTFMRVENDRLHWFEQNWGRKYPLIKFRGLRLALYDTLGFISKGYKRPYHKKDLPIETFFEQVSDSKALNVPSYNLNMFFEWGKLLERYGIDNITRYFDQEFHTRKQELFQELKKPSYNLLMSHFHRPDAFQDLFHRTTEETEDWADLYKEMDELAEEIKKAASDKYDWILFMSDHGLGEEETGEHNKNAFYSSNRELGLDEPHITDFHSIILEAAENSAETSGINV